MTSKIKRPWAGTQQAQSQFFRFTRNGSVNTEIWQPKSREQLDAAKATIE